MAVEFEIEKTGFGARVKLSSGEVIGVVTRLPGGTFSATAFKEERVRTMNGVKRLPESSLGTSHKMIDDAAKAIAEIF